MGGSNARSSITNRDYFRVVEVHVQPRQVDSSDIACEGSGLLSRSYYFPQDVKSACFAHCCSRLNALGSAKRLKPNASYSAHANHISEFRFRPDYPMGKLRLQGSTSKASNSFPFRLTQGKLGFMGSIFRFESAASMEKSTSYSAFQQEKEHRFWSDSV